MSALDRLAILDLTPQIAQIPLVPAHQVLDPRDAEAWITFHYSAVVYLDRSRAAELARVLDEARYQIQKNWAKPGQPPVYGDGLMYDFVILTDGTIVRTRRRRQQLWHVNNLTGNSGSWSNHWMLGPGQDLSPAQRRSSFALADAQRLDSGIPRHHVVAHCEWPLTRGAARPAPMYRRQFGQSACPGALLHQHVAAYRAEQDTPAAPLRFQVTVDDANVRQGPATTFPIAGVMHRGDSLIADKLLDGQPIGGDPRWAHRMDGLGFVHMSLLEPA